MGVEARVEGGLVRFHGAGRITDGDVLGWTVHVREAARANDGPVCVLVVFEAGIVLPASLLAAGTRQTFGVLSLIRAVGLVGLGAAERTMLRATTLAVRPPYPVAEFADEASARAWLERVEAPNAANAVVG